MSYSKTNWQNLPNTSSALCKANLNKIEQQLFDEDILNVPTNTIASNDDLDDYTTVGVFATPSGTVTGTLSNCPVNDLAIKLKVEHLQRTDRIRQTIYANSLKCDTYVRYNNGSWGEWKKVLMEDVTIEDELTVNSNYFSTIDRHKVRKFGKIVIIDFRGLASANIPSNTDGVLVSPYSSTIGTGETGFAFAGDRYGTNTNQVWFYMGNDNSIKLDAVSSGKWVHIHHVYMTND